MNEKNACAVVLGSVFFGLFIILVASPTLQWPGVTPLSSGAGPALWNDRTYEALLQGMIVLAGVLSILLLLGKNQSGKMPP